MTNEFPLLEAVGPHLVHPIFRGLQTTLPSGPLFLPFFLVFPVLTFNEPKVPEDKFWEPLHEDLWHSQLYAPTPIVIDSGSRFIKVGAAGEDIPRYVVPSLVAYNRANEQKYYAGWKAFNDATDPLTWRIEKYVLLLLSTAPCVLSDPLNSSGRLPGGQNCLHTLEILL